MYVLGAPGAPGPRGRLFSRSCGVDEVLEILQLLLRSVDDVITYYYYYHSSAPASAGGSLILGYMMRRAKGGATPSKLLKEVDATQTPARP